MMHTISLNENRDFMRIYRTGKCLAADILVIYVKKSNLSTNRLGITVSKKVGNAVVRNRVKRLIKESYRLFESNVKTSYDIVIVARNKAAMSDYRKVRSCLLYLFNKSQLFK